MSTAPWIHMAYGGIDCTASSRKSVTSGHVVAFESVDVASQEGLPLGVDDLGPGFVVVEGHERGPRSLQRAVDGRDARPEELRDLGRLPAQHLAQDQHRPLAGRQVLQSRHERQAYGLP